MTKEKQERLNLPECLDIDEATDIAEEKKERRRCPRCLEPAFKTEWCPATGFDQGIRQYKCLR